MMLEPLAVLTLLVSQPAATSAQIDCAVLRAVDEAIVTTGAALAPASVERHRFLATPEADVQHGLGLTPVEMERLGAEVAGVTEPYQASCWFAPYTHTYQTKVSFTRPLFVRPDLAVVGVAVDGHATGSAHSCAARRVNSEWRATCKEVVIWAR